MFKSTKTMVLRDKETCSLIHSEAARRMRDVICMGRMVPTSKVIPNKTTDSFPGRGNDLVYSSTSGRVNSNT